MTKANYNYAGLIASTWDVWRDTTSRWDDSVLFLDIVRRYGQPALDIGCATGRIVLDYLAQGIDMDGVDNSPEMLAICRDKAKQLGLSPNLYQQTMESLALPRTYRTILVPSSTFQLITNADHAREAMRRFFAHLQAGGALIMPFYFDWQEGEPIDVAWRLSFEKTRPEDGAIVRSWVHSWVEPDQQFWHHEQRFEVELNGEVIAQEEHRQSPETRWYSQAQAVQLFRAAGFGDIQLFHKFTHEAAAPEDRFFCALGIK
jgi:ubiquinone/menaquinone biosynthesis C-methylase UbiE